MAVLLVYLVVLGLPWWGMAIAVALVAGFLVLLVRRYQEIMVNVRATGYDG